MGEVDELSKVQRRQLGAVVEIASANTRCQRPLIARARAAPIAAALCLAGVAFVACGDEARDLAGSEASVDASSSDVGITSPADGSASDAGDMPDGSVTGSDASALDDANGCGADGMACTSPTVSSGLCKSGQCAPCNEALDQAACATGYGDAGPHVCAGGTCVAASCSSSASCPSGQGCAQGTCVVCDAQAGNTYVVDPGLGSLSATGSGKASSVTTPACAFRTVRQALDAIAAKAGDAGPPPPGTTIVLRGPKLATASSDDPIWLPENVTLAGEAGGGVERPPAYVALVVVGVTTKSVKLRGLVIDGIAPTVGGNTACLGTHGDSTVVLEDVELRRCDVGLRASDTSKVTVNGNTTIREMGTDGIIGFSDTEINVTGIGGPIALLKNGTAITALGSSKVTLSSSLTPILIAESTAGGVAARGSATVKLLGGAAPITLRDNGVSLSVQENAKLVVKGDAAARNVLATNTTSGTDGLRMRAFGGSPSADIAGFVAEKHSSAGLFVGAGTTLKLRDSVLVGNGHGLLVTQSGLVHTLTTSATVIAGLRSSARKELDARVWTCACQGALLAAFLPLGGGRALRATGRPRRHTWSALAARLARNASSWSSCSGIAPVAPEASSASLEG